MYKNSVIHILENIENRKRKNKHMLLYQYNNLLSPLGFIFFLLPHFSLCWAPAACFLVFYLVLVLCSLRWRRLGRTKDRSTCWYEGAPGLSPAPKLSNVFTVWGPSWSQQVGSWRQEKQAAQVHPPWLPHPPQSQPIGKSKIF